MKVLCEPNACFHCDNDSSPFLSPETSKRKFNQVNAHKAIVLMKSSVTVMFFLHISKLLCIAGGANILSAYRMKWVLPSSLSFVYVCFSVVNANRSPKMNASNRVGGLAHIRTTSCQNADKTDTHRDTYIPEANRTG